MNHKIALVASAGGHLNQLLSISDIWKGKNIIYVTSLEVSARNLRKQAVTYVVGECNRQHPLETLGVLWKCLKVILQERPKVVISTGAAPGFLMCFWGKLFGAKVIWLDSIANTKNMSMSGRMVRPFADLILTQWPQVASRYTNVEYVGEVI